MFDYSIIKNPEVFEQNRMKAHSDHEYYEKNPGDCRYLLNGMWKFHYAPNIAEAPRGFEGVETDCRSWEEIPVPAHIQMQGYDVPQYANSQYPWDGREEIEPGQIPEFFNPTASYVKYFTVPESMKGRRLYICFAGVESGFALWMNGVYVGYSEDSFTPAEFELTEYLADGENKLAVQVYKWTAGSWCEDQDFFRFSGIFRDVYLFVKPELHVADLFIRTILNESCENGELIAALKLEDQTLAGCAAPCSNRGKMMLQLYAPDGSLTASLPEMDLSESIRLSIQKPLLWSAESPSLYTLCIRLSLSDGTVVETVTTRIGFRSFEIEDSVMKLNGKRIVFRGVNRHEFSARSGRVLSEEDIRKDLITCKRNNINAIRTCHYPNSSLFYRLCDEYGIYVLDETNLETHGTWLPVQAGKADLASAVPGDRPEYLELILDRANSMVQRDKNHPCVLIWSCGNESYGGKDIFEMSNFIRSLDDTRPVHYEGIYNDRRYPATSDIESTMYVPADEIRSYLKEHRDKPYINCEYAHAMGNSCGALHKYTALTDEDPLFQGGFIWDYIDQCIIKTDRYGQEYPAYGGDFGDRPCDYAFSGNGIVYGDNREPSPKMQEVKFCYQNLEVIFLADQNPSSARPDERFDSEEKLADAKAPFSGEWPSHVLIRNKYLFTSSDAFTCILTLEKEGKKLLQKPFPVLVLPLEQNVFPLPSFEALPETSEAGEYTICLSFLLREDTCFAPAGYEIAYGQTTIWHKQDKLEKIIMPGFIEDASVSVIHGSYGLGVKGKNFDAIFSDLHGGLTSYRINGKEILQGIPKPNFWRAVTSNDLENQSAFRSGQWKAASLYCSTKFAHGRSATPFEVEEKDGLVCITYIYHLPTMPAKDCRVRYTVLPDGTICVEAVLDACREVGELPEFSMAFTLDADFQDLTWYGLGPEETYADRQHAKLGIYHNAVADNAARYLVPQECGAKAAVRWARLNNIKEGIGIDFLCNGLFFSALPWSPGQMDEVSHFNELGKPFHTYVRIGRQMGIGGDDTWGALVHPEYLIDNQHQIVLRFGFKGVTTT